MLQGKADAPALGYFQMATAGPNTSSAAAAAVGSWGLEDLTVYITHYCAPPLRPPSWKSNTFASFHALLRSILERSC